MQKEQNIGENIQSSIRPLTEGVTNTVKPIAEGINNTINNVSNTVSSTLNEFSSKEAIQQASSDFLQSNSIIAKFAFIILVLILFVFLFTVGIRIIGFFTDSQKSPYLVKGLIDGTNSLVISQDPRSSTSVTLQRSNNNKTGIEFTWSVWLLVKGKGNSKKYSHVFNKGDVNWNDTTGISNVNNGPGLYLSNPETNKSEMGLYVVMDTEDLNGTTQKINISTIPLNKWFNVCIRMQNIVMDVYVNGTNSGRLILPSVPRQNFNDVNICQNGGFVGSLSNLRYFDYALSAFDINSVVWSGPSLYASKNGTLNYSNSTNYISNLWYFSKMA